MREHRTSNMEHPTSNHRAPAMFDVQSSMFRVRCSEFDVQSSMFDVRCSMFDVRCSMFQPPPMKLEFLPWLILFLLLLAAAGITLVTRKNRDNLDQSGERGYGQSPLTPALSLGERENPPPRGENARSGRLFPPCGELFPLHWERVRDEGKRFVECSLVPL